jgi:hypothetical protein
VIELVRRGEGESSVAFMERARSLTVGQGAPRHADTIRWASLPPREAIVLPDGGGLHPGQARAACVALDQKRVVLRGRPALGQIGATFRLCAFPSRSAAGACPFESGHNRAESVAPVCARQNAANSCIRAFRPLRGGTEGCRQNAPAHVRARRIGLGPDARRSAMQASFP